MKKIIGIILMSLFNIAFFVGLFCYSHFCHGLGVRESIIVILITYGITAMFLLIVWGIVNLFY